MSSEAFVEDWAIDVLRRNRETHFLFVFTFLMRIRDDYCSTCYCIFTLFIKRQSYLLMLRKF